MCVPEPETYWLCQKVKGQGHSRQRHNRQRKPAEFHLHCVSKKRHPFYFHDDFVRCRPILLILDMIIGQSIYNVPALTYLLETEILSVVEYQLKFGSVADNATWFGLVQRVVDKAINEWHGRLCACVRADGQHFEHLLWAVNFSFGLILLSNFTNRLFVIITLSNCCLLYKVQLQHKKPGVVGWVTLNFHYNILLTCVC